MAGGRSHTQIRGRIMREMLPLSADVKSSRQWPLDRSYRDAVSIRPSTKCLFPRNFPSYCCRNAAYCKDCCPHLIRAHTSSTHCYLPRQRLSTAIHTPRQLPNRRRQPYILLSAADSSVLSPRRRRAPSSIYRPDLCHNTPVCPAPGGCTAHSSHRLIVAVINQPSLSPAVSCKHLAAVVVVCYTVGLPQSS